MLFTWGFQHTYAAHIYRERQENAFRRLYMENELHRKDEPRSMALDSIKEEPKRRGEPFSVVPSSGEPGFDGVPNILQKERRRELQTASRCV